MWHKITEISKLIWAIGGRWLGLMSGPPSVILFCLGLYLFHGTDKEWFWIGAFICLGVFVFQFGWKNYRLLEKCNGLENKLGLETEKNRDLTSKLTIESEKSRDLTSKL